MAEFHCLPCLRKVKEGTSAATGVTYSAASTTSTDSSAGDTAACAKSQTKDTSTPSTSLVRRRSRQTGVAQAIPQPWHNEPFHLVKLTRKTRICRGCGGGYLYKTTKFVVRHKENNPWFDTRVGAKRASFGNAYYHAHYNCIIHQHPYFKVQHVLIDVDLTPTDRELLSRSGLPV